MSLSIQRADFWKRISAFLFDLVLAVMLAMGIILVFSAALDYDEKNGALQSYYAEYETQYNVDFDISEEDYEALSETEKENHAAANKAFLEDPRVLKIQREIITVTFTMVSVSILLSTVILYFALPLLFKNGQTLGKKIFGIAVMRSNCVKVSPLILFVRTVFGLYAIETMFPIALLLIGGVGKLTIGLLFLLQAGVLIGTKNRTSIHDLLSDTVVVDMASQRIFDSQEEMLEHVKQLHAEEVAQAENPQ